MQYNNDYENKVNHIRIIINDPNNSTARQSPQDVQRKSKKKIELN